MRTTIAVSAAGLAAALLAAVPATSSPAAARAEVSAGARTEVSAPARTARTLVFSDEFNGTALDTTKWQARSWSRGGAVPPDTWSYSPSNVHVANGRLELSLGNPAPNTYTGAAIDTAGKFSYTYGALKARVKVPPINGHLAAVWLNTGSIGSVDGTARDGEEIDVVETNSQADKYAVTVHWDGYGADHRQSGQSVAAPSLHSGWHVFGLTWTPSRLIFTYDGTRVRTITDPALVSQVNEYVLLSHEILDGWADGSIHDEVFDPSSSMYVDWIRVYQ